MIRVIDFSNYTDFNRCGNSSDMSQKSLLELVLKSTQVFREEYLARQCKARQEILHRMTVLQVRDTAQNDRITGKRYCTE